MPANRQRIEFLDSIRGLAALAVLLGHSLGFFAWHEGMLRWASWPLFNNLIDGSSAVAMFFVLSGYVLSRPYLTPSAPGQNPRRLYLPTFYLRRLTRIWIPWAAAFLLSAVAQAFVGQSWPTEPPISEWQKQFWQTPTTWHSSLLQCFFLLHDSRQALIPQDWSLGVELRGSVLLPFLLLLVRRRVVFLLILLALIVAVVPTGAYYVSFGCGILIARYQLPFQAQLRVWPHCWKWALFLASLALYQTHACVNLFWESPANVEKAAWCLTSIACSGIIVSCLIIPQLQKILSFRWLTALGRISFSIYLFQLIAIIIVLPPLVFTFNLLGIKNQLVLCPFTLLAAVTATFLLSLLTYRFVEVPSMALGYWLTARIQTLREKRLTA